MFASTSSDMKKCSYCGKEYPDDAQQCQIDAQPLISKDPLATASAEAVNLNTVPAVSSTAPEPVASFPNLRLTDWQIRIFEVVLLCLICFGGSILFVAHRLLNSSSSIRGRPDWLYATLHEVTSLALLWYILLRRSRSVSDLGFTWTNKDLPRSVLIFLLGTIAFSIVYGAIYLTGLTSTTSSAAGVRVGRLLFGGGVSLTTILFQFINPFYEELIVRAYVMTEVMQLTNSVFKAVMCSTLLQMSYHFYQGAPMALSEGATFLVFSIYYARTNRITPIILAHLYMDVWGTIAFMFGQR